MYLNIICKTFCIVVNNVLSIVIKPSTLRTTKVSPFTEIQFYFKKGSSKKFPMSVAPMNR